jgi:hypothetical protein
MTTNNVYIIVQEHDYIAKSTNYTWNKFENVHWQKQYMSGGNINYQVKKFNIIRGNEPFLRVNDEKL